MIISRWWIHGSSVRPAVPRLPRAIAAINTSTRRRIVVWWVVTRLCNFIAPLEMQRALTTMGVKDFLRKAIIPAKPNRPG
ncbi:hypothetical protein DBV15_04300 [Temnothorax longispinosus]|uniref:Uncharacterized protein n=1 Tax=Temnothorax longispinosus TaxID=300112 RepID=A0A4S2KTE5_9HYME|nr:hypothetical protein DBV15_04300 [Temnothorax longispinosus]